MQMAIQVVVQAFVVCYALLALALVWSLLANQWTGRDRMALLDRAVDLYRRLLQEEDPDPRKPFKSLDSVPYEAHLWRRLTLRDPYSLYLEELRP